MNVLVIGQSNGAGWFENGGQGAAQFIATAAAAGVDVTLVNACVWGSPLTSEISANCWSDESSALYENMLSEVAGRSIDAVIWIHGEKEAVYGSTETAYTTGLCTLLSHLRADLGEVPLFVQQLDGRGFVEADPSLADVQRAQRVVDDEPGVILVEAGQPLFRPDGKHFGPAETRVLADAMAREVLDYFGDAAPTPIAGTNRSDEVVGTSGSELVYGLAGDDALSARQGSDAAFGGSGADRIHGGAGRDTLVGGYGADILCGGGGSDQLWGEGGADVFVLQLGGSADRIHDFGVGADRIVIKGAAADVSFADGTLYYAGKAIADLSGVLDFDLADIRFDV